MAHSTKLRLRAAWFQVHKWIGISLAILIIPLSLSGSALVWHDALDRALNPARYAVAGPAALAPSAYADAASRAVAPGERIATITYPEGKGPVVVGAAHPPAKGNGRPVRTMVWLDPAGGRVLDAAASDAGAMRVIHMLHGSLLVPGAGRRIVGWIGVAMLLSSLTGLWLWWPLRGRWTRGFRWKRQASVDANLHHLAGFWVSLPLAMLSLTGAWIAFPAFFGALSGAPAPSGPPGGPFGARPLAVTRLTVDEALAAARPYAVGALASIAWPTDKAPTWKVAFRGTAGPREVAVDDATGKAAPPGPQRAEPLARTMRRLHDGTGMGPMWQAIIFVGGLIPALLAVTGLIMWLRTRGWRGEIARKRKARAAGS